jgi:hypothetical protein
LLRNFAVWYRRSHFAGGVMQHPAAGFNACPQSGHVRR